MRSAGCVINDWVDKDIDAKVTRTCHRPLVSGQITDRQAKVLLVCLLFTALILVVQLNYYAIGLSIIALLLALIYPFMKRYMHWPQAILGMAFGIGIPMAYAALNKSMGLDTVLLFLANACWVMAYDTQYAMVDRSDDLKIGVKSTAVLFGRYDRMMVGVFQGLTVSLLIALGYVVNFCVYYHTIIVCIMILFIYQQYLIYNRRSENCFKAFQNNQYVGMVLFFGITLIQSL